MKNIYLFYLGILFGCAPLQRGRERQTHRSDRFSFFKETKNIWPAYFSVDHFCHMMNQHKVKEASRYLNLSLLADPTNKYLHLLNGLVYEERARMGDSGCAELASVAYQRSLGAEGMSWAPRYFRGICLFKDRDYAQAQKHLSKAFVICPENPKISLALACASYCVGDLPVAVGAIEKALRVCGHDPQVLNAASIIFSASKQGARANECLARLKKQDESSYDPTCQTVKRWNDFYQYGRCVPVGMNNEAEGQTIPLDGQSAQDESQKGRQKELIVMDCVLLSHDEDHHTYKGNNLLERMTLALGGESIGPSWGYQESQKGAGIRPGLNAGLSNWTKTFKYGVTQSALNYSLNIMNAATETTSVMAHPTITTEIGTEGYFDQGVKFVGATPGSLTGSALASFDAGIVLQVTPVKLENGYVSIELTVEGSYFPVAPSVVRGITDQVVSVERSKVSSAVNVKLGKTALVGSVHLKMRRDNHSGVPGLSSVPFLQYFFSRKRTEDTVKSAVVLITPRLINKKSAGRCRIRFDRPSKVQKYLVNKGFQCFDCKSILSDTGEMLRGKTYLFRSRDVFFGQSTISLKNQLLTLKSFLWY